MWTTSQQRRVSGFTLFIAILLSQASYAAWYDFASQKGVPEISELSFGKTELTYLPDLYQIGSDQLEGNALVVRGLAEISDGRIGVVMVSIDGGKNWKKAHLDSGGAFNYEFTPQFNREYAFRIKAIATTGKASDPNAGAFQFVVTRVNKAEKAKQLFAQLLNFYVRENRSGFLALVSDDFEGDLSELEDAIEDDFRFLDSISIQPTITRIVEFGDEIEISFTYDRRVVSQRSGQVLTDSASSSMGFRDTGEGLQLTSMAAPLIFGVSGASEVATTVEGDSVGQDVLLVTETGDTVVVEQLETVEESTSDVRTGTATLNCSIDTNNALAKTCQGFNFSTQTIVSEAPEDVFHATLVSSNMAPYLNDSNPPPPPVFSTTDADMNDLGTGSIDQFTSVSSDAGDYEQAIPDGGPLIPTNVNGNVYAFMLDDMFALIRVVTHHGTIISPTESTITVTFQYKVQLNGTSSF